MEQLNIFELTKPKYKITKPIRLIELFAGIGSQAKALSNIGANFEHHRVVEFDKYAIASYNSIHGTSIETSDITKIGANDLEIIETEKYEYIMTYSFPCQDLSLAGKGAGMGKGTNTRSGLLWEVERLLDECLELPQILLMENVPQVIGQKNFADFREWQIKLEQLGYSNYFELLNAKDYGIPQNRNRCFMVSVLGDYYYEFPRKKKLKLRLKDMLEDEVDEKYYLSDKMIEGMINTNFESYKLENKLLDKDGVANTIISRFEGTPQCIVIPEATKKGYAEAQEGDGVYINRPHQKRGVVQKGMIQTIKTQSDDVGVVVKEKPRKDIKELEKHCEYCGEQLQRKRFNSRLEDFSVFKNRKFCDIECMKKKFLKIGEHNQSFSNAHTTARRINSLILKKNECELCGSKNNIDVHHLDGNWQNNNLDNLQVICRSCHMLIHKEKGVCCICGKPQKGHGFCNKHYLRFKKYGDPHYAKNKTKEELNLRIRKLTPREVFRLMGFDDEDFEKVSKVNSNAQLYKQAGNSIVVNVLEAIFRELF